MLTSVLQNKKNTQKLDILIKKFCPKQRPGRIKFLYSLPKRGNVAEIGVAEGSFSECILEVNRPKELHLVDCWEHQKLKYRSDWSNAPQKEQNTRLNLIKGKFKKYPQVKIHKGYSLDVVKLFPDHYFDWIYLDADHTYKSVRSDLEAWYPKIKKGGIIAGHDYKIIAPFPIGVIKAVDEFIKKNDLEMFLMDDDPWASWALRKKQKRSPIENMDYFRVQLKRNFLRSEKYERAYILYLIVKDKINKFILASTNIKSDHKAP